MGGTYLFVFHVPSVRYWGGFWCLLGIPFPYGVLLPGSRSQSMAGGEARDIRRRFLDLLDVQHVDIVSPLLQS